MAKQRSEKSRYPSQYGGGWVSAAQYLTECLCVLIAKQGKKELLDNFWNEKQWTAIFRRQAGLAAKLLKIHPPEVILNALRDRRCWKIRSFGANWLIGPLLAEKQRAYDATVAQQSDTVMTKTSTVQKPQRIPRGSKSLFSQLKEAE